MRPDEDKETESPLVLIEQITEIRKDNNDLWMDVLRVAMLHAPDSTKEILKRITKNDRHISSIIQKMTE